MACSTRLGPALATLALLLPAVACGAEPPPPPPRPEATAPAGPRTTGVPAGTELERSGGLRLDTPGQVVSGLEVHGTIVVTAPRVTIEDTRVVPDDYWAITVADSATDVVIRDSEIDGRGTRGVEGSSGVVGGSPRLERLDIHGVENGVIPGSGTVVTQSWIHDLAAPGSPHYDGVQMDGGQRDVVVERSRIDVSEHTQTSAVMINNHDGPVDGIRVTDNVLLGGGYPVYADGQFSAAALTDVVVRGNRLGRGAYGYVAVTAADPTWEGNTDYRTGRAVER